MTWTLTPPAFEDLLAALDADRARAAERYEQIRRRVTKLFEWRGCANADDLTDETFDRVARRLSEGAKVTADDVYLFFHGVALNVLREHWRADNRAPRALMHGGAPLAAGAPDEDAEAGAAEHDLRLACLARCLDALPPESRRLVAAYHLQGNGHIAARKALAADMNLPVNALRIRVFRLRQTLGRCVAACASDRSAP